MVSFLEKGAVASNQPIRNLIRRKRNSPKEARPERRLRIPARPGIVPRVRAIHITLDESLLRALDADAEVQHHGRSAVVRRAVSAYLKTRRRQAIAEAYRRGYGAKGEELRSWAGQGAWPEP
jgi:predicted transcriptional regulator